MGANGEPLRDADAGANADAASRPPSRRDRWPRFSRQAGRQGPSIREGQLAGATLRRESGLRRMLVAADLVALGLAAPIAVHVIGHNQLLWPALVIAPALVALCKVSGLYDRDVHLLGKNTLDEAPAVFRVATLMTVLSWLAGGWLVEGYLGRPEALALWGLLTVLMLTGRSFARRIAPGRGIEERCLVVGGVDAAAWMGRKLDEARRVPARIVASTALANFEQLPAVVARYDVDRVVIMPEAVDPAQILDAIRVIKELGVRISVVPRLFEVVGSAVEFDDVQGLTLLGVRRYGLARSSLLLKRTVDVLVAAVLLVVAIPLLGVYALVIRLGSPGGPVVKETRIGRRGARFAMYRLPTETLDGETTRFGRFLRRSYLDELPQLINVLRGEMSFVGPRPLIEEEMPDDARYGAERSQLLPGITGVWQILGPSRMPRQEMVVLDYLYGANWSLWLDVKIILRTVPIILTRRGA